jgi:dTDP-4-dehydrorhamnose 3,5-epimerase-like enzyme
MKNKFIKITTITDERGSLSFTQNNLLPFSIKRIFYLTNLNGKRGGHSHYNCEQLLYCISGSCTLYCYDGEEELYNNINNLSGGFYTPSNHWLEIYNFSSDCVILVLCSNYFDKTDYCRDKLEFSNYIKNLKNQIIPIKLNNIVKNIEPLKNILLDKFDEILSNGQFINGIETNQFEEKFSKYMNLKYTVSCCNGTAALFLALQSLNIPEGSEVLVQTNAYIADIIAILNNNLKVKWIDIDNKTLTVILIK